MVNISNKAIAVLLVIALAITISGTFISINRLLSLQGYDLLTGAAVNTTTGTSTITVVSRTQITNRVSTIAFGSGYVNTTDGNCNSCNIDTFTGILAGNVSCCAVFNNITAGFLLENTGNENLSVNMTCAGSCNASNFINGTSPAPSFQFRLFNSSDVTGGTEGNNSGDSLADSNPSCSSGAGGWNYSGWTNMDEKRKDLCGSNGTSEYFFDSIGTADAVIMDLRVAIPEDSRPNVEQTATITFSAASSG